MSKRWWMGAVLVWCLLAAPTFAQNGDDSFRVALTGKYPPFSFYDGQTGELIGFDVDVSRSIAKELSRPLEIVPTEWDGILAGLLAGKFDAIIGSMAVTNERKKKVRFSDPYYVSGAQLFIHRDDAGKILGVEDLQDTTIGVVRGETFEQYMRKQHSDVKLNTYKSTFDIFEEMKNRRIDGFLTDRLVGLYQIKAAKAPFVPAGNLLYRETMAIPVRKGEKELAQAINQALAKMEDSGQLAKIHEKWFGVQSMEAASRSQKVTPKLVAVMLGKGFALTLLAAFSSLTLGFILAVPTGVALHGKSSALKIVLRAVVDFIRGTPVLIQLFFVYFALGNWIGGINLSPLSAAIITLTVNSASYMAEIVRSGLLAVDPGQKMAARALGLTPVQTFRFVVWPQAFRVALPALMNSAVALLKDTALISVIAVPEAISAAQSLISITFNPGRYYFIVALLFFIFTFPLMKISGYVEKRIKQRGFDHA